VGGPDGIKVKDSAKLTHQDTAGLLRISHKKSRSGEEWTLEVFGKVDALPLLGLHLGLFSEPRSKRSR
jgi:hypothetical protein